MKEVIACSGSSGFLGSHLSERLGQFEKLGRDGYIPPNVDVVFDLASFGNMVYQTDVKEIYKANLMRVIDSVKLLDNKQKFIYISTSSVLLPVQTPYSLSKKATEEYLKICGKRVASVRPFTLCGVGEQEEHLIPKLIDSCLNGTEMPFVQESVHDFIDVDDFVDALLLIKDNGLFEGEIYEVGSGKQYSNLEVLEMVNEATGKNANIRLVDSMRSYDTKEWKSKNERIYSLGWEPEKNLEQTIKEMVEYAKQV